MFTCYSCYPSNLVDWGFEHVTADYQSKALPTKKISVAYCAAIVYIFVQYLRFRCPRCVRIRIYFCSKFLILFFYSLEFSHLTFGGLRADLGHACTYQAARSVHGCSHTRHHECTVHCTLYNFY